MKAALTLPSQAELKELLEYDSVSGVFRWKVVSNYRVHIGDEAGTVSPGEKPYIRIGINHQIYRAHRLAWMMHYGEDPGDLQIDHINGVHDDNRIVNLRLVDTVGNCRNMRMRPDNSSGMTGVSFNTQKQKWFANITVNRSRIFLGSFKLKRHAIAARKDANLAYGFHENHGTRRIK